MLQQVLSIVICCLLMPILVGCFGSQVEHLNVSFDIAPNGTEIAFSSADGDLYLFNLETKKVRRLTTTPEIESNPVFSPDGKSIVYSAQEKSTKAALFMRSLEDDSLRQLTDDAPVHDSQPAYSPDGANILFARAHLHRPYSMGGWTWDDWDIYTIHADGTGLKRITNANYYQIGGADFVNGGKAIVFAAEATSIDGPASVERMAALQEIDLADEAEPIVLNIVPANNAKSSPSEWSPDVSPNGTDIAFISDRDKPYSYDLCILNRKTAKVRSLGITNISTYNGNPRYTPDGKRFLFLAGTETNAGSRAIYSLWSVDANGNNARQLADSGLFTNPGTWKPKRD